MLGDREKKNKIKLVQQEGGGSRLEATNHPLAPGAPEGLQGQEVEGQQT